MCINFRICLCDGTSTLLKRTRGGKQIWLDSEVSLPLATSVLVSNEPTQTGANLEMDILRLTRAQMDMTSVIVVSGSQLRDSRSAGDLWSCFNILSQPLPVGLQYVSVIDGSALQQRSIKLICPSLSSGVRLMNRSQKGMATVSASSRAGDLSVSWSGNAFLLVSQFHCWTWKLEMGQRPSLLFIVWPTSYQRT